LLGLPLNFVVALCQWQPNPVLSAIAGRIDAKLKSLSQEEWLKALKEGEASVDFLLARVSATGLTLPPSTFMTPFKEVALQVLEGEFTIDSDEWEAISNALPQANRKAVAKSIMADMRSVSPSGAASFVHHYAEMAKAAPLDDYAENSVDKFLRALISSESEIAQHYVRQMQKSFKKAIGKVDGNTRDSFVEVIDGLDEFNDEGKSAWAQELRDMFGIVRSKTEEGPESKHPGNDGQEA
jgi:hypothetical protein